MAINRCIPALFAALSLFLLPIHSTAAVEATDAPTVLNGGDDDDADPCLIRIGDFRSQTMGGWGTNCNGNNPGCYRDANFDSAFPDGVTLGCAGGYELTFTSSGAVQAFLPQGSTAVVLSASATDPTSGGGVLAGQLLAAKLSVGFDISNAAFGASDVGVEDLEFEGGNLADYTLAEVIALADDHLGGCASTISLSDLVDALDTFNNAFVGGESNTGTMRLPGCGGCCGFDLDCPDNVTVDCTSSICPSETGGPMLETLCSGVPADDIVNHYSCGSVDLADDMEADDVYPDACSLVDADVYWSYMDEETGSCPTVIERTFMAEVDVLSGSVTETLVFICHQTITVNDNTPPSITCPADLNLECGASTDPADTGTATATDDCGNPEVSYADEVATTDCSETITRTWTATDDCGNMAMCVQTITLTDTEQPYWTADLPGDVTVECGEDIPAQATLTAMDDCQGALTVLEAQSSGTAACGTTGTILYVWSADDGCNHPISHTQTITIVDTTPPTVTIDCPADYTVDADADCNADTTPASAGEATGSASDNCDAGVMATVSYSDGAQTAICEGSYTFVRTWTASATDDCGNSASASCDQTITVNDNTPPTVTIDCPADYTVDADADCNADTTPASAGEATGSASDNCDAGVMATVSYSDGAVTAICEGSYTFVRTWTASATDDCGNSASASCDQTITVNDNTPPTVTIDCPADYTVDADADCNADTTPASAGEATGSASDNCDAGVMATVSYSDGAQTAICEGSYTFVRTWTASATDDCGNSASASCDQTITVNDNTPPTVTIDCPADYTVDADADCNADTTPASAGEATGSASDNCDAGVMATVSYSDGAQTAICEGSYTFVRTWTASATDDCGNSASASCDQTITVNDNTPPTVTIDCPADYTVDADADCNADTTPASAGEATGSASDNCDAGVMATVTYSDGAVTAICEGSYTFVRTWTASATDDCGNSASASCDQTITVNDNTPPTVTIDCPADYTVDADADCNADTTPASAGEATGSASDNCDAGVMATVSYSDGAQTAICEGSYTFVRTWTASATDDCGNSASASCDQTITVNDNTPPTVTIDCPADYTVDADAGCNADTTPASAGEATGSASDNCDAGVMATVSYSDGAVTAICEGSYTFVRTWTASATDDCGNSASASCDQTITVNDNTPPTVTIDCPADYTVDADADCNADTTPASAGEATGSASDNCDAGVMATVSYSDGAVTAICEGSYTFVRTWTASATDDCGNSASATCDQTITVNDNTPPTISCPADLDLECGASTDPADTGTATATDNCSTPTVTYSDEVETTACVITVTRTWMAEDDCGNTSSCTQTITLTDTEQPYWTSDLPEDMVVECSEDIPAPADLTAEDNCQANVTVTVMEFPFSGGCGDAISVVYQWMATDGCTEPITHTQTIVVVDTTPPALVCPEDLVLDCNADLDPSATGMATATDNCGDVTITYSDVLVPDGDGCGETLTRTWVAVDECENESTCDQVIRREDNEAPYWTADLPADLTLECGEDVPAQATLTATDDCQGDLPVAEAQSSSEGACGNTGTILYYWTADDGCGHMISHTQTITIVDTTPPALTCPDDADLECGASSDPSNTGTATATDACGEVIVSYEDDVEETEPECAFLATITRTWTATDECGNTSTCVQVIDFVDGEAPQITETCGIANGETIEVCCTGPDAPAELPEACEIEWTDNCGAEMTYSETTTGTVPGETHLTCSTVTPVAFEDGETCANLDPHSLRLFGFPGAPGIGALFSTEEGTGEVVYVDDTEWGLTMRVVSNDNPNAGFDITCEFGEGLDWDGWSSRPVPSAYKLDCPELPDNHLDWMYFILQSGTLTGWGDYAGSSFTLTHQPFNEYYGFQVGESANNMNANYGFSGWIMYSGTLVEDGVETEVMSSGDLFGDLDCCLPFTVSRTYTIEDCEGNTTVFTYHVVSDGEVCEEEVNLTGNGDHTPVVLGGNGNLVGNKTPLRFNNLMPNPTSDFAQVAFTVDQPMRVRADLTDMQGNMLSELFDGMAQPGATYTVDLEVDNLASGMYQIRLASNSYLVVRKLLVTD